MEQSFCLPQGLLAVAMAQPVNIAGTALYNYTEGYGSYLIPAVMVIIIFSDITDGHWYGDRRRAYDKRHPCLYSLRKKAGQSLYVLYQGKRLFTVVCMLFFSFFLLGLLPHFFSIPNIGNGLYIVLMMIPYLLATSFLGLAASRYFTDSEAPLLMIAFFSVGLIFLSGVSYPMELMPWYWKGCSLYFSGSTCYTRLCEVELNGSKYG